MLWSLFVRYKNVLWHNLKLRYVARQVSECVGNFGLLFGPSELAWSSNLKTVYNPVACISYFAPSSGRKRRRYNRPTKTGLRWLHVCHLCTKQKQSINGVWTGSIGAAATEIARTVLQQAFGFSCSHYDTNTWNAHGYCRISAQKQKKKAPAPSCTDNTLCAVRCDTVAARPPHVLNIGDSVKRRGAG